MSIQEKMDKLIAAHMAKLEESAEFQDALLFDQKSGQGTDEALYERRCEDFARLRVILEDILELVDREYLHHEIRRDLVVIQLGVKRGKFDGSSQFNFGDTFPDVEWVIEPGYRLDKESGRLEKSGFKVKQTDYEYLRDKELREKSTSNFGTERDVSAYLINGIAQKIAEYRFHHDRQDELANTGIL